MAVFYNACMINFTKPVINTIDTATMPRLNVLHQQAIVTANTKRFKIKFTAFYRIQDVMEGYCI